jgi:hypothetical protein
MFYIKRRLSQCKLRRRGKGNRAIWATYAPQISSPRWYIDTSFSSGCKEARCRRQALSEVSRPEALGSRVYAEIL